MQRQGSIDVNWFASEYNAKITIFYSRFWNRNCTGVDAFMYDWSKRRGLFVPPLSIVHRVLQKMSKNKAFGVLVVPYWESAILALVV